MGTMNHNAIIASTWSKERADNFQAWINKHLNPDLVLRSLPQVNDYQTFVFVPDGSKEGWEDSDTADGLRDLLVERLAQDDYEDGSSPWDWVEVGFGEYGQKVIRGNKKNCYNDKEYAVDTPAQSAGEQADNQLYRIKIGAASDCWIADIDGDPGRTVVKENAKIFTGIPLDEVMRLTRQYPNRAFGYELVGEPAPSPLTADDICECGHDYEWHYDGDNLPSGRTGCANPAHNFACKCPKFKQKPNIEIIKTVPLG